MVRTRIMIAIVAIVGTLVIDVFGPSVPAQAQDGLTAAQKALAIKIEGGEPPAAALSRTQSGEAVMSSPSSAQSAVPDFETVVTVKAISSRRTRRRSSIDNRQRDGAQAAQLANAVEGQRAMVTRYHYKTGDTTRTIVDLKTGERITSERLENYPTPLTDEEMRAARLLLLMNAPDIKKIVDATAQEKVRFNSLVTNAASKSAEGYGERRVVMWLSRPKSSEKYVVNLSKKTVSKL